MKEASRLLQDKALPAQAREFEVINAFIQFQVEETRTVWRLPPGARKRAGDPDCGRERRDCTGVPDCRIVSRSMSDLMLRLSGTKARLEESIRDLEFQKQALDEHAIVSITDALGGSLTSMKKFLPGLSISAEELPRQDHGFKFSVHPKRVFF